MRPGPENRNTPLVADSTFDRTAAWTVPTQRSELDRLAQMAAQLAGTGAALLVDVSHVPPEILGSHGLDPDEAAMALDACATPPTERADTERWLPGATGPFCYGHWLPVFDAVGQSALLLLDRAPRERPVPGTPALQLLAQHASDVLALARRCEQSEQYNANVLRESESRLNLTEHTAGAGSWSLQLSTREVVHSDEFATILGLADHHQVRNLEDMVQRYTPEWRNGIRQRLERCALQGEGFDEEIQVMVEGGTPKWVRTVGTAVRRANGQIVRIQGAIQDISAQKQAQQDTLRLAMRLTTTLASITEAFVTLDRQCCFTYLNQESERLLQKTTGDLLGQEVWQDFSPALTQRLKDQLTRSLSTNRDRKSVV